MKNISKRLTAITVVLALVVATLFVPIKAQAMDGDENNVGSQLSDIEVDETETDPETETDLESEPEINPELDEESEEESEAELEQEAELESEVEIEQETELESEAELEPETEIEDEPETEIEDEPESLNGLVECEDGITRLYRDDEVYTQYTGLYEQEGVFYYLKAGVLVEQYHGFYKHSSNGKSYYIQDGVWQKGYDGLFERAKDGKVYSIKNGIWQSGYTGLYGDSVSGEFYYLNNGVLQSDYVGFYNHSVNGKSYYIKDGAWQNGYVGLCNNSADGKYYYLKSGIWQSGYVGLYEHSINKRFYYLMDGIWQYGYEGIYTHSKNGWKYYLVNGIWKRDANGICTLASTEESYFVTNGLVDESVDGIIKQDDKGYNVEKGIAKLITYYVPTYYNQKDSRWAYVQFGYWTFGTTGCAPTSIAMAASGILDKEVTPLEVGEYLYNRTIQYNRMGAGTTIDGVVYAANEYGLNPHLLNNMEDIQRELELGRIVYEAAGSGVFCYGYNAAHAIVLYGYEDGKVNVYDPLSPRNNGQYTLKYLFNSAAYIPSYYLDGSSFVGMGLE